jgi:glycosyltransferase involved in cell wall biosynthesis
MLPVSIIIPTLNEERNIAACIASVRGWADQVFVLDSLSNDRTVAIAESLGAHVYRRRFDDFSRHKNWALDNLPLHNDWILFLDADERVTDELRCELDSVLAAPTPPFDGYYVGMRYRFMGGWLNHGGVCPNWNLRLFKHRSGRYEDRIVHEHVVLDGRAGYLRARLEQHDHKGLERYIDRHNIYSSMEALEAWRLRHHNNAGRIGKRLLTRGPERRRLIKEFAYRYLPCRALLRFVWMYLVRGGFLDGRTGFRYCALAACYEYQVSLKLRELESDPSSPMFARHPGATAVSSDLSAASPDFTVRATEH